ncbi:MAG: hypothetical protein ACYCQI_05950 [Gammaproteobacteria bacterium]
MWSQTIPDQSIRSEKDREVKLKHKYKSPEDRVKEAEHVKQTYAKTITKLFDSLTVIKNQYACDRFMTSLNIEHEIDVILTSIKENQGDFALQSDQFFKCLSNAYYEDNEVEDILEKLSPLISLAIELKQARLKKDLFKALIYDRIERIVKTAHDLIALTAFPVSRYKPPSVV